MTMRSRDLLTFTDDDGNQHQVVVSERYYIPSEDNLAAKVLGFQKSTSSGQAWGLLQRSPLTIEDFEMLVIAEKQPL